MFTAGVRAALIASRFAASLMLPQRHGLIVNITAVGSGQYLVNVFYRRGQGRHQTDDHGMARDLRPHNIAPSRWPGFIRTSDGAAFEAAGTRTI